MNKTYWLIHPRKFQNEYTVGVSTTAEDARQYEAEGYRRIDRDYALRLMSRKPGNGESLYVAATLDGEQTYDRFRFARSIRTGSPHVE